MNSLTALLREFNPEEWLMASVGKDGDQDYESEVCLYFWGEKCFIQAKGSPNSNPEFSVCKQRLSLDA